MKKLIAFLCALAMLLGLTATVAANELVVAIYNGREYTSMEALLREYDYGDIHLMADVQDLEINKYVWIDLNGHDIHNVTVKESVLYCFDSQTDDYSVADGVYGEITGSVVGDVEPEYAYMEVKQESGISFHRVDMGIYEMTLRPSVAGVYYKSYFCADEVVAARVERYGVALSVENIPAENNIETECVCSYFEDFQAGSSNEASTTLLKNIMKPTNSTEENRANSLMYVFGAPYLQMVDGYYFNGNAVQRNLKEQVEAADAYWETLDPEQQEALVGMYEAYPDIVEQWDAPNTKGEEPEGGDQPGSGDSGGSDDGDITITIGLMVNAMVDSYYDNAFTNWLQEESGYNLEFIEYPSFATEARNQINTQIAMGEKLPDILWGINLGDRYVSTFGREGYLKDLTPYFNDRSGMAKTFWDRIDTEVSNSVRTNVVGKMKDPNDGKIYAVPSVTTELSGEMGYQVWINQQWLDALDLEMPTNIMELYDVLVAFRDKDPNGNGMKDEIPLMGTQRANGAHVIDWLINQFIYFDSQTNLNVDKNGKVYAPFTTEAYREALKFANKLYKENLLSPMVYTLGSADLKLMFAPASGAMCGVVVANPAIHVNYGSATLYQYAPLPNWGTSVYSSTIAMDTFISADCEHPEEAFELLMLMWSKEASLRMRFGEYGVNWVEPDPDAVSGYGIAAEIDLISDPWNDFGSACWYKNASTLVTNASGEAAQLTGNEDAWELYRMQMIGTAWENYREAEKNNPENICPVLTYTEAEDDEYQASMMDCKRYQEQMRTQFIMSLDPSNDANWNNYLATLEEYGLQDWLEVAQTAYDRQK